MWRLSWDGHKRGNLLIDRPLVGAKFSADMIRSLSDVPGLHEAILRSEWVHGGSLPLPQTNQYLNSNGIMVRKHINLQLEVCNDSLVHMALQDFLPAFR